MWALWNDTYRYLREIESQSWSLSFRSEEIGSVAESASECLGVLPGQHPTVRPTVRLRLSTTYREVLSGALKITQRGIVNRRRSYGPIWQSVLISLHLSVCLTPQKIWSFPKIKCDRVQKKFFLINNYRKICKYKLTMNAFP